LIAYGCVSLVAGQTETDSYFVDALAARVLSIFTLRETLESSSLQWRLFEADEALRSIGEHPWLGVGLGNSYREVTLLRGEASGHVTGSLIAGTLSRFTRYIHSSYLSIGTKMGLPALLCFWCFCAMSLINGWQLYRSTKDGQIRSLVLAVVAGLAGLLLWSITHPHLMEAPSTVVVGLVIGLLAGIAHVPQSARCPEYAVGTS
jgi:O-antigen ligase